MTNHPTTIRWKVVGLLPTTTARKVAATTTSEEAKTLLLTRTPTIGSPSTLITCSRLQVWWWMGTSLEVNLNRAILVAAISLINSSIRGTRISTNRTPTRSLHQARALDIQDYSNQRDNNLKMSFRKMSEIAAIINTQTASTTITSLLQAGAINPRNTLKIRRHMSLREGKHLSDRCSSNHTTNHPNLPPLSTAATTDLSHRKAEVVGTTITRTMMLDMTMKCQDRSFLPWRRAEEEASGRTSELMLSSRLMSWTWRHAQAVSEISTLRLMRSMWGFAIKFFNKRGKSLIAKLIE